MERWTKLCLLTFVVVLILSGCGATESYSKLQQPENTTLRVSVGQPVFRIQRTRDLPNAFGKADLFGRKVESGYQELRYLGLGDESTVVFAFLDREIFSDETTMSRTGAGFVNLQHTGSFTTGVITAPPSSTTQVLPAYGLEIKHNFRENPLFEHSGIRLSIIRVSPTEITYSLSK